MTAPKPYGRGRPYPAKSMIRARELADAGWFPSQVRAHMLDEGIPTPDLMTVKRWTNADYNAAQLVAVQRARRRARAKTAVFRLPGAIRNTATANYRAAFVQALEAAGVLRSEIGKVCGVVLGDATPIATKRGRPAQLVERTEDRTAHLLERGLELRARGMTYPALSIAFEVYEGESMAPDTLRHWLTLHGADTNERKRRPHLNAS